MGAGKIYNIPPGPLADKTIGRLKVEFDVLSSVSSPHILRPVHTDLASRLMISEYYPAGTLAEHQTRFAGQPLEALTAFRGLVQAVAELHNRGIVHRDIKPVNIFVARDVRLVLGDFGIVFVESGDVQRLTDTFERVGTRDWMPPWAHTGTRVDDVTPAFDVFSLGKVLWSMLSGSSMLPYWYWNHDSFNVEKRFPDSAGDMRLINERILAATVVQFEKDALANAGALLERVDEVLAVVHRGGDLLQLSGMTRPCRVCGRGAYKNAFKDNERILPFVEAEQLPKLSGFGHLYYPGRRMTVRPFICDACGHVQLFRFADGDKPSAWTT